MMPPSVFHLCTGTLSRLRARQSLFLAAVLAWSGCATGDYAYMSRISSGERIQIMLVNGNPQRAQQGTIEVRYAGMRPGLTPANKQMIYFFTVLEKSGKAPRSVRVEDVSDEKPVLLVEDLHPELKDQNKWVSESKPVSVTDPAMHWLTYVDDVMRVFQFTIVDSEGKTIVLNQGWFVPGWVKHSVRQMVGMEPVK